MFEPRVTLLSDYAETYRQKGLYTVGEKGFWQRLIEALKASEKRLPIAGMGDEIGFSQLQSEGFTPFCKIDERIIFAKKTKNEAWIAIAEDEELWDLSDWGEDTFFVTRLLAECYFMITRDDFRIDEDEREVFLSLVGLLQATSDEIKDARNLVYWTLVENVIEDNEITDEEEETMVQIRTALEMEGEDVKELHRKAIQEYYNLVVDFAEGEEPDLEKLASIKEMADKLGVSIEEIS